MAFILSASPVLTPALSDVSKLLSEMAAALTRPLESGANEDFRFLSAAGSCQIYAPWRLFSLRPGSLITQVGFQNGDGISRINACRGRTPDDFVAAVAATRHAPQIRIDIMRRGFPMRLVADRHAVTWAQLPNEFANDAGGDCSVERAK